jgi:GDPmannose 4,6-dehydratase
VRALITGAAGQDGTILATRLAREGAEVVGLIKPGTDASLLLRYAPTTTIAECDLGDADALRRTVLDVSPTEIFNLGGISSITESVENPELTHLTNVDAVRAILEAMVGLPGARMFQASSAAIFEGTDIIPQTARSRRAPNTPYAKSKAAAMDLVNAARDIGVFAVSGILYNHESPLRGTGFVTRHVTMGVARIAAGLDDVLEIGDIEVARDWGWAPDYVRAMQLMLRADVPHDYVIATGISHRLSFFLERSFRAAGITDWRAHVVSTIDRTRTSDTNKLVGESRAAYVELGWRHTVDFDTMAANMVRHDIALLSDPDALWQIP